MATGIKGMGNQVLTEISKAVKEQAEGSHTSFYRLIDIKGGGLMVELMKKVRVFVAIIGGCCGKHCGGGRCREVSRNFGVLWWSCGLVVREIIVEKLLNRRCGVLFSMMLLKMRMQYGMLVVVVRVEWKNVMLVDVSR